MSETLQQITERLWIAPDDAEWTPKSDVVQLDDLRRWMQSEDIEILGRGELSARFSADSEPIGRYPSPVGSAELSGAKQQVLRLSAAQSRRFLRSDDRV